MKQFGILLSMLLVARLSVAQVALGVYPCQSSSEMGPEVDQADMPSDGRGDVALAIFDNEVDIVDGPATLRDSVLVARSEGGFEAVAEISVISTHGVKDVIKRGPLSSSLGESLLATLDSVAKEAANARETSDALGNVVVLKSGPCFLAPWDDFRSSAGPLKIVELEGLLATLAEARTSGKRRKAEAELEKLLLYMNVTLKYASLPPDGIRVTARLKSLDQSPGCGVFILFSLAKYEVVEGPGSLVGTEIEVMIPCAEMPRMSFWREAGDLESFKTGELHDLVLSRSNFLAPHAYLADPNPAWFYLRTAFQHR